MHLALAHQTLAPASAGREHDGLIKGLLSNSVYGICLTLKRHVLATHRELSVLRRCAELLRDQSQRIIQVVAASNPQKADFIVSTLQHLGVSCGQIEIRAVVEAEEDEQNVWLFVTERGA